MLDRFLIWANETDNRLWWCTCASAALLITLEITAVVALLLLIALIGRAFS